jgi:hypothetical protein
MCDASMTAVEDDGQNWGTYYATRPRVLIGSIGNGVKRLQAMLGAKYESYETAPDPQFAYLEAVQ